MLFSINGGALVHFSIRRDSGARVSIRGLRYSIKGLVILLSGCGLFISARAAATGKIAIKFVYLNGRPAVLTGSVMAVVFAGIIIAVLMYKGMVVTDEKDAGPNDDAG